MPDHLLPATDSTASAASLAANSKRFPSMDVHTQDSLLRGLTVKDLLSELGALSPGDPAVVIVWHRSERRTPAAAWRIVLQLVGVLRTSARLETSLFAAMNSAGRPMTSAAMTRLPLR